MSKLTIIKEQISAVKAQTEQLIATIAQENWLTTPAVIETNLNWQIGHIIVANYLHGIASMSGVNAAVRERIDVPQYIKFYGPKSIPANAQDEKPSSEELLAVYDFIFEAIDTEINQLTDEDLGMATAIPNPNTSVKTKYDALMLLFKHQTWHNGQIAMLKRILAA